MASIRERVSKSGERTFQVLYRHGGKQPSLTFVSRTEAEKFKALVEILDPDAALAALAGETPQGITVDELAERFLEWKARDVTPRTLADYRRDYTKWVKPAFGHRAAEAVDEADVQRWVDKMARTLAPKSTADKHMILHAMYAYGKARTRKYVTHNPCGETELPKRTRKPPKGTTVVEWRAILTAAGKRNPDAGDLILFLGSLGWRWSEAAALDFRDVEDDGTHVWVDVTRVFRLVDNRQMLIEDAAKGYASFRRSRVPAEAAAMLRRRLVGKGPGDFIFTNSRGGHWNQTTFLRDTWPNLLEDAGVGSATRKPTPHWLRHMAVANMAKAGIPIHEIQRIIGHKDLSTTNNTYGGMIATLSPASLVQLDAVIAGRVDPVGGEVVTGEVIQALTGPDDDG